MQQTEAGSARRPTSAPNPAAILEWVLDHQIIVRRIDIGHCTSFRACRKLRNGKLHHLGRESWTKMEAIITAYLEANQ